MIHVFLDHIQKNKLWEPSHRLLLAVSGGCDSMALLHLCWRANFVFEVAHVNYGLRAQASDLDQQLVELYCAQRAIPCHVFQVPIAERVLLKANNLQEKARDMRYTWLEKVRQTQQLDFILTAHHAQDQAETMLWHLMRGTGVRGMAGIAMAQGFLRRPLLFAMPEALASWLTIEHVEWRQDSSNLTTDYTRNKIRHHVVPSLQQIRVGSVENIALASAEMQRLLPFLADSWTQFVKQHTQKWNNAAYFKEVTWIQNPSTAWMLSWWLKPLGFTNTQLENLRNALNSSETKVFVSPNGFRIWVNRTHLWFADSWPFHAIQAETSVFFDQSVRRIGVGDGSRVRACSAVDVDAAKLAWPLSFRMRQMGDRIKLRVGRKKVSDVFIDHKVPSFLRAQWPLLVDAVGEILWIPGIWIAPWILASDLTPETVKFEAEPWISP